MTAPAGASVIAQMLAGYGVTHVFFVDAVLRRTLIELEALGVRRVLAHSEKAAVYMADGYARASGRVGVCFAQSVGAANLAAGLQDAYLHRAPIVALTGRKAAQSRNAYQEIAHGPLFAAVTSFAERVDAPDDLPRLLRQAFRAATGPTPRPVHLDLLGLQAEGIEVPEIAADASVEPRHGAVPAYRAPPDPADLAPAASVLAAGQRVAIVAGAGATLSGAEEALLRLARILAAPVATSLGARGIIDTRDPLSVGTVGSYGAPPANEIVHAADCVLVVGSHLGDQPTLDWRVPAPGTRIVQIDADPAEIGRNYPNTLPLPADPRAALEALAEMFAGTPRDAGFARWAAERVATWRAAMAPHVASDAMPIRPDRLCAEITEALPKDAILVADTGYSGIWTATCIDLAPPQTYLRAAGSLGWSFPAAIGAKCACPDRPVLCFSGDGAIYYHLPELETARRLGRPLVLVINNNSGFGQGLPNVRRLQGNRPGHFEEIIRFGPTDFARVAEAFGVRGIRVEDPAAIAPALCDALAHPGPVVVDVATDIETRAPEPWIPEEQR
ncbi:thiamine pyrophosphate-binding protein [Elioraea tepidiphila]|uniref:thiamine pyrophosphate-binding protein n=1 Tax=Elioraea tepidiphila TaxID=457934 RepID=UPI00035CC1BA|nr:thiamine pyrophosphate-binding protein [Elioraea tepidiphila]